MFVITENIMKRPVYKILLAFESISQNFKQETD